MYTNALCNSFSSYTTAKLGNKSFKLKHYCDKLLFYLSSASSTYIIDIINLQTGAECFLCKFAKFFNEMFISNLVS